MSELQLKHRSCPLQVKSMGEKSDDPGAPVPFSLVASVFYNVDAGREIVDDASFNETIPYYLGKGFVTVEHEWEEPIGKPMAAAPTSEGLAVEGEIYPKMYDAASVVEGMRRGVYQEASIGYYVEDSEILSYDACLKYWASKNYTPTILDHQRAANGVKLLKKIRLEEVAICVRGMNSSARVTGVKTGVKSALKRIFGSLFGADEKATETPSEPAAIEEKELNAIVDAFMPAIRAAVKQSLTEQAVKATCEVIPKVPQDSVSPEVPASADYDDDDLETAMAELELIDNDEEAI